ncbi:FAD:protein FMN transferase [Adhaeribacter rhizoryzae]|nr:FAD:protein FMN transferase [Adhaeribacter rhizoryzae]
MGTLFRIALYASDSTQAGQAARAAFNRVAELNHILSDYEPNSELNQLCRTAGTGQWVPVSKELWFVLKKSVAVSERTKGAFDVTVGPYVQLWRRARRQGELPTPDALAQARKAVGYQHLKLNNKNKTVQLAVPNMQLDMGAIGKGYAVDEALKILRKHGIKSALIDGGGNIVVSRPPPGTKGWAVSLGITAPTDNTRQLKLLLKHQGVATSGDLYQYLILDGVRYSHILNPFTGLGLTDQSRVTIVARNGLTADWLSTAVSVLGPTDGLALADKTPGAAASFIRQEKDQTPQWLSRRFKKLNTSLLGTE